MIAAHNNTKSKNILIVEDDRGAAETFKELLEILGHQVEYVMDGRETAAFLKQKTFDLIFMDINLPDISGIELLNEVKSTEVGCRNTKFVAVSGHSATDSIGIKAMEHFDFYLEKPVDLVRLDQILTSF